MTKMKFNARELDQDLYVRRAKEEASQIYAKPDTRRGRSFVNILQTTLYGHAPEVYLIDRCGFTDDERPYKDVIDTDGNYVEVKATKGDYYVPYVLKRANEAKQITWKKYPDILYIFIGDKKTADYELEGVYKWNGTQFVVQKTPTMV
jgi:hypothetical protein